MSLRGRRIAAIAALAAAGVAFYWPVIANRLAPSPPAAPEKLTIAVIDTYIGSGLVLIAKANGFFAAEGLDVTLQPHGAGRTALDAVLAQKADMATVGNMPVMFATLNKTPVSIVATIASSFHGAGILARRDHGIAAAADLKGKTIGVTLGTDGHFVLNVILADRGMAADAVKLADIPPRDMVTALSTGRVDAIATWEPLLSAAKKALGEDGVTIDMDRGFAFWFHLAGEREFVRAHPATMQKLLRALLRAERLIEEHPAAAAATVAASIKLDPSLFDEVWPNFRLHLALPQGMLTTLEDQTRWAMSHAYANAAEVPNFLDAVYLDGMLAVRPQSVSIIR